MDVQRRSIVLGMLAPVAARGAAAAGRGGDVDVSEIGSELRRFREPPSEVLRIRTIQYAHLRATGRFPDFIEIGSGYFDAIHDWLFMHPHPVEMARLADGRYVLQLGFTQLVLRADVPPDFVGQALTR